MLLNPRNGSGCGRVTRGVGLRATSSAVGERIRQARLEHGWSHEELARRMGVNWRTVYRWQSGRLPRFETLEKLADVLEVQPSFLIQSADAFVTLEDLASRLDDLASRVDELARSVGREDGSR